MVIPAGAHLNGNGNGHSLYDGAYNFFCQRQVLHQSRTIAVFNDFLYRTAHIDIDDIGTGFFNDGSGLGHDVRVRAENLHRQRVFPVFDVEQFCRMLIAVADALGAYHFSAD